jgi:hypothetical protein
VAGPGEIDTITIPSGFLNSPTENLYLLGHGDPSLQLIADANIGDLAARLKAWFEPLLLADDEMFLGDIKLVVCFSGEEQTAYSGAVKLKPTAERLAEALEPGPTDRFRPRTVQGIVGVGWVDETSGRMLSIDFPPALDYVLNVWGKTPTSEVNPFQEIADRTERAKKLRAWFGKPLEPSDVPGTHMTPLGTTKPDAMHVGKGPKGKRRFHVPRTVDLSNYPHGATDYLN